ncbi:MAG TPA: Tad domain-containing protein [Pyrinomonadaceae bacterium]|jgi:Flp pilus assembly protein TadG|nr:Tad domain-containing protein [Pyrinomonadaceae bacterium]
MNSLDKQHRHDRRNERGSVLAISTLGMLAFLLATGLCVDVGHLYLVKTELQNAADAAALAGASALNSSSLGITKAKQRAETVMNNYEFNKKGVKVQDGVVEFAVNLAGPYMGAGSAQTVADKIRFIRVKTPAAPTKVFFASMVIGSSRDVTANATAGMSVPLTSVCDFLPVSVVDYGTPIMPGNVYTFRSGPSNHVTPGNYQILAVAGRGGSDVRVGLASGVDDCAEPGEEYAVDTKPGVTSGPVRAGINTRFDDYQGGHVNPTDHPPDTNIKENITYEDYVEGLKTQAPSHPGVEGRRVVVIPIIKESEYDNGRGVVRFNRFGLFFLRKKVGNGNGGDLEAEYIKDHTMVGRGGVGTGAGAAEGLLAKPVLYQ